MAKLSAERRVERAKAPPPADFVDILERIADAEALRARDLKTVTAALKPLGASLTPEQLRRIPAFLGLREGTDGLPQPTAEIWLFEEEKLGSNQYHLITCGLKEAPMPISFLHSKGTEAPIKIPAIGLDLFVRMPPAASSGEFCFIETINAPGAGPPRHRHREAEIFRVIEGRYLYEADGRRFYAEAGDVVSIPGGVEHGFCNVTDKPARQYILMAPALDAAAFFTELAGVMHDGIPDQAALNAFGQKWHVEFLGPPVSRNDQPMD